MTDEPINPYAPPAAEVDDPQAAPTGVAFAHPLFSPKQMLAAALFGTVLAGVILLQANYRAMARPHEANKAVLYGVLATLALLALPFFLPDSVPSTAVNVVVALGFYKLADTLQGDALVDHRDAGGERQSNWLVFGISVGTRLSALMILFLVLRAWSGLAR